MHTTEISTIFRRLSLWQTEQRGVEATKSGQKVLRQDTPVGETAHSHDNPEWVQHPDESPP